MRRDGRYVDVYFKDARQLEKFDQALVRANLHQDTDFVHGAMQVAPASNTMHATELPLAPQPTATPFAAVQPAFTMHMPNAPLLPTFTGFGMQTPYPQPTIPAPLQAPLMPINAFDGAGPSNTTTMHAMPSHQSAMGVGSAPPTATQQPTSGKRTVRQAWTGFSNKRPALSIDTTNAEQCMDDSWYKIGDIPKGDARGGKGGTKLCRACTALAYSVTGNEKAYVVSTAAHKSGTACKACKKCHALDPKDVKWRWQCTISSHKS